MLKRLLEVEGRGSALWMVLTEKSILGKMTSGDRPEQAMHRIRRTGANLIQAFTRGNEAHLSARVTEGGHKRLYRGRTSTITLNGDILENS